MFRKVVGSGAQALVLQLKDAQAFADVVPADLLDIHAQQIKNRGLVAKIMRTDPWHDWLKQNGVPLEDAGLVERLRCVNSNTLATMTGCAQRIAALRSNFVIPYVNVVATEKELRILMPRYSMTLQEWAHANQDRMQESVVLKIAYQLALGLIDLHDEGIYHLDFHGGNVFVANSKSADPHCVIADLEASYYDGISPDVSRAFTEPFAAPERSAARPPRMVRGPVGTVLENTLGKCDVWSLGALLYSMAADHEFPGLAEHTPDLGTILMNHRKLTPTRIAAIVQRDLSTGSDGSRAHAKAYSDGFISLLTMMLNHDPLTRPSLYVVLESLQRLMDDNNSSTSHGKSSGRSADRQVGSGLSFPLALGPFDVVALSPLDVQQVEWYGSSGMYDIHARCCRCGVQRSRNAHDRSDCQADNTMHMPSHASALWCTQPLLPVTMQQSDAAAADRNLSSPDMGMVFMYPMVCDAVRSHEVLADFKRGVADAPLKLLQLQGGFSTMDLSGKLDGGLRPTSVVTIVPRGSEAASWGGGHHRLHFSAAQPWPSACNLALRQAGRVHSEVPSLLGTTAKCFSWILPGESFTLPNGESWVPAPEGGFVFWFEDNASKPHEMDRYFALCTPAAVGPPLAQRASLPSRMGAALLTAGAAISGSVHGAWSKVHSTATRASSEAEHTVSSITSGGDASQARQPLEDDGEPGVGTPCGSNLSDRTPAGRLYFDDLEAVSPATFYHRSGITAPAVKSIDADRPTVTSTSPVLVGRAQRTNLLGGRIGEAPVGGAGSLTTSRNPSESRPSTFAQTATNSAIASREPSSGHTVHFGEVGHHNATATEVAAGGGARRYPSYASTDMEHTALSSRDASTVQTGMRAGSSADPTSTRPSSFIGGAMPPATRTTTPTQEPSQDRASILTDPSPIVGNAHYAESQLRQHFHAQAARGGGRISEGGAVPAQLFQASPSATMISPNRNSVSEGKSNPQSVQDSWSSTRLPTLWATVLHPFTQVVLQHVWGGNLRFRIVASGEFGTCGPTVPLASVPLLATRLGMHPSRIPDARHVCFCAVDVSQQPPASSSVGPGGTYAASAYHASERYLQHHGLLLLNEALDPCALVSLRVVLASSNDVAESAVGGGSVALPLAIRGPVPNGAVQILQPHGVIGDFDPFLAAPSRLQQHAHRGGMHPPPPSSRPASSIAERPTATTHRAQPIHPNLAGCPATMAMDLHQGMVYFAPAASSDVWLQMCLA